MDYIRIQGSDHWVVTMRADDPLAAKEFITKKDLLGLPLILPERTNVQSELANWFGKDFSRLNIVFTSNLGTNAGIMAVNGLGYPVSIEGAERYWPGRSGSPAAAFTQDRDQHGHCLETKSPYSPAVNRFIEEINAWEA